MLLEKKMNVSEFINFVGEKQTYSQLYQDLLVCYLTEEKENGYFVEFGATDGLELNNTYMLEKEYNWTGILCEPNPTYHDALRKNRNCNIDTRCVHINSGSKISFLCCADHPMASTIDIYRNNDEHANIRYGSNISVETVSLNDLLDFHSAPDIIDYMSIDTEGSELDILLNFKFSRQINIMTIEHNNISNRELIYELMKDNGFTRIFTKLSRWDDWYINNNYKTVDGE